MGKWHQAIARREASRVAIQTNRVVIEWSSWDAQSEAAKPTEAHRHRLPAAWHRKFEAADAPQDVLNAQVVLIDRALVERSISSWKPGHQVLESVFVQPSDASPLFLLWDWGISGKSSLGWATSLGFSGVIFDFSTLRSWARVAVERLPSKLKELHPLVASLSSYQSVQR
jgi:hypothetical protein